MCVSTFLKKLAPRLLCNRLNESSEFAVSPDQKSAPGNRQTESCIPHHLDPWRHHQRNAQNQAAGEKQDADGPGEKTLQQDDASQEHISNDIDERHQDGNVDDHPETLEQSAMGH